MEKQKTQYRQGDLLIETVGSIPADAVPHPKSKSILLAHGEATGHHHTLELDDPADWWKLGEEKIVKVATVARITHQEHRTILLPAGTYKVRRQREYTPEA
ncbi:MAG: hypothetical protein KGL39_51360, partial [Patescibacteria group bacterium]|nr:hypothetical protein [Patescibacteria group bacterium]